MSSPARTILRRSPAALGLLAALLGLPATLLAQQGRAGVWRIEPSVGIWHQGDHGVPRPQRLGPFVGLQVSRQYRSAARLTASAGYHRLDDAYELQAFNPTGESRTYTYDRELISTTAGVAGDIWEGGGAAVSLAGELGAGWNRSQLDRSAGAIIAPALEPGPDGDWRPLFVAIASVAGRHAIGPRLELTTTARFLAAIGDMEPGFVPALTVGTAYRF